MKKLQSIVVVKYIFVEFFLKNVIKISFLSLYEYGQLLKELMRSPCDSKYIFQT